MKQERPPTATTIRRFAGPLSVPLVLLLASCGSSSSDTSTASATTEVATTEVTATDVAATEVTAAEVIAHSP